MGIKPKKTAKNVPNWKRITLVVFVLIGGTMSFGYWSFNQFDSALDDLSASVANTLTASPSLEKKTELASTSPEMSEKLATSTDETIPVITSTTTPSTSSGQVTATGSASSPQATPPATATSIDLELSFTFTFPKKGDEVYIGCTYQISWQSSTAINSLQTALVDAGTRESMGPIASGLAKENTIETDSQNLNWKVSNVWPGAYYIAVSKINGAEAEFRSKVFEINKMSKNISASEKENVCKESGGSSVAS